MRGARASLPPSAGAVPLVPALAATSSAAGAEGNRIDVLSAHSLEAGEGRRPATDASGVPLPKQRLLVCQGVDQARVHLQELTLL